MTFAGCVSLAAVDLSVCTELAAVASCAFCRCRALTNVSLPASLRKVGRAAFFGSGLRRFDASELDLTMGEKALAWCWDLEEATFGTVTFADRVFYGCQRLALVEAAAVANAHDEAWLGAPPGSRLRVSGQASTGQGWRVVGRAASGEVPHLHQIDVRAPSRLQVLGPRCRLSGQQRRLVREVDLSVLWDIPAGLTLQKSQLLETVRLPRGTLRIPERFLADCPLLSSVNVECCAQLREVGTHAFCCCPRLERLLFPRTCRRVDVRWTAVVDLDLSGHVLEYLDVGGCGLLRRLILPHGFRGQFRAGALVSLSSLTYSGDLGDSDWRLWVRHREVRYASSRGEQCPELAVETSRASVLGEVCSLCRRESRPFLPC
jgi:hypothetical protein